MWLKWLIWEGICYATNHNTFVLLRATEVWNSESSIATVIWELAWVSEETNCPEAWILFGLNRAYKKKSNSQTLDTWQWFTWRNFFILLSVPEHVCSCCDTLLTPAGQTLTPQLHWHLKHTHRGEWHLPCCIVGRQLCQWLSVCCALVNL